jgi:RNA ligase (TIGR02306 family)
MRKLASIQVVEEIQAIPEATNIERVRVQGWWCVALKNEFHAGDKCVYFQIDSLLPAIPQFSFMAKGQSLKKSIIDGGKEVEGYRLKTAKKMGMISQGLALPLSAFPGVLDISMEPDTDISVLLGVYLFEPPVPACLAGDVRGVFPGYIPKSDEERIQTLLDYLTEYRGRHFYSTVKVDGSSMTCYNYQGDFGVCSRNLNLHESEKNTFWRVANKYDLRGKIPDGYAIQGECAGEGINDNRHKLRGQDLYVFYVFDIAAYKYLELEEMEEFCSRLGLKTVPVFDRDLVLGHTLEELLARSNGPCPLNPGLLREGLVYRLKGAERKTTFKCISNEYLIKYGL